MPREFVFKKKICSATRGYDVSNASGEVIVAARKDIQDESFTMHVGPGLNVQS